jgi:peptidylprolyl isomerase
MRNAHTLSAALLALALLGSAPAVQAGTPAKKPAAHNPSAHTIPAPSDVAAPPADAETTASGLASKVLKPGTGTVHPALTDSVKVHYTGWTTDGKMFDSSVVRGTPISFRLDHVIAGWSEGVQLMVEGEKRRLWIPAKLAYEGKPDRPQGMLVFDVELIKIEK